MRTRIIAMAALASAATALPAATPTQDLESRLIAFELREGGRLVASPSLSVKLGEPATILTSGPNGYRLQVTLERPDPAGPYLLRSVFSLPHGGGWAEVGAPSMTVAPGEQARVTLSETGSDYSIAFTVR